VRPLAQYGRAVEHNATRHVLEALTTCRPVCGVAPKDRIQATRPGTASEKRGAVSGDAFMRNATHP
jgi:hypothetical protein